MPCEDPGVVGYQCTLTAAGTTIGKAQDVALDLTRTMVETTTRDSGGAGEYKAGQLDGTGNIDQLWVPTNAGLQVLQNAFLAGTHLAMYWLGPDDYGWAACAVVSGLSHPQPLNDAVQLNVALQISGGAAVQAPTS